MLKKSFILLFICIGFGLYSNNLEKLNKAIEKIDYDESLFKYLSRTITEEDGETTIQEVSFNPLKNPEVELLSVNGSRPTDEDIENFFKELEEEGEESMDELLGDDYYLISVENGVATYSYTTKESVIPKKDFKMDGLIVVDLEKEEIVSIKLKNPRDFKMMGAKLTVMEMEFYFESFNNDYLVLRTMNFNLNGKFLLKEFSQRSKTELYNYEMVN